MKKIIVRILIALIALILVAALAAHFFLDGAIKRGVETFGPQITKVSVKLDSVSLSVLSGSGKIKGLVVGNPEGFKTPSAISVGTASLALQPTSLLSDKIVVKSILVEAPEITFETDLKSVNLKKILANVEEASSSAAKETSPKEKETKAAKKLQVDDFKITGGKVHVSVNLPAMAGQSATVKLPDIQLSDLGKGTEGITPAELSKLVLQVVVEKAEQEATSVVSDMLKGAKYLSKDVATNAVDKVTKGIGDLFKKKQ